ncbi:unnamed protein product [Fraxinus pennsylvanica]|uniref:Pentatricopeptide repeat-containing protein n=1 Tax=Fraxinus pennsylvanica TaxID=56036 RepID=A0AAD1ZXE0_9LAMI|nr:unnamed protein product [Fraxinus pennsylvanica]
MPKKDLVSWNSLISGFSRKGELNYCLNSFHRMRFEMGLEPNEVSLICIISACTERAAFCEGNYIHGLAIKTGFIIEIKVVNSLINMYWKLGYLDMARRLFDAVPKTNLVSWNSIIMILVQHGVFNEALEVFKAMRRIDDKPDQATMMSLLQGCGIIGVPKLAEVIHGYILSAGLDENITIATSVLSVYAKSGRLDASYHGTGANIACNEMEFNVRCLSLLADKLRPSASFKILQDMALQNYVSSGDAPSVNIKSLRFSCKENGKAQSSSLQSRKENQQKLMWTLTSERFDSGSGFSRLEEQELAADSEFKHLAISA